MVFKKIASVLSFALILAGLSVSDAKADSFEFTSTTGNGICCFDVDLVQLATNKMQVTVTLEDGATVFVNSGNGSNHPGFAFNLKNDPNISIAFPTNSAWAGDLLHHNDSSSNFGDFDYYIDNPGSGGNATQWRPARLHHHRQLRSDLVWQLRR